MDLDALTAARRAEWDRLSELERSRGLSGTEVDEFVARYQGASADLADIKTSTGRAPQGDVVSTLISSARVKLTRSSENPLRALPRFFALQLPAALYRLRWTTLVIAGVFIGVAAVVAFWISGDPALVANLGTEAGLQDYAEKQFIDYYDPAATFAGSVWANNAWIALQCVLFGITGIWPVSVIVQNAVGVGTAAAVLLAFDAEAALLYLIPHGLLELTSIFVAGAAGLHLFWSWIAPGARSRGRALADAGVSLVVVAIGLVLTLLVSGLIEGFVTGQPWPWWIRIGIGVLALGGFLFYMLFVGGRAHRAGETGGLAEFDAGTPELVAG